MKIVRFAEIPEEGVSHNPEILKRVILRKNELPHLTNLSMSSFKPGQITEAHAHEDMAEVFLITAGTGCIIVDGKKIPLEEGSCAIVEPGETHQLANCGNESFDLIYFGVEV